jgi:hypothetical protein
MIRFDYFFLDNLLNFIRKSDHLHVKKMNNFNNKENITTNLDSPKKQQSNTSKHITQSNSTNDQVNFKFSSRPSLENIRAELELFCKDRNWEQYHTPRNLLLGNSLMRLFLY